MKSGIFGSFLLLCAMFQPASGDPFRIQDLTTQLEANNVENISQAILFGQPMVTGRMSRFSFNIGLRDCARLEGEDLYCTEAAFKACVIVIPSRTRQDFLELANTYNLSRRLGYVAVDGRDQLGPLLCVQNLTHFQDENILDFDEIDIWQQTVEDFRSFLTDEEVELLDSSLL